MVEYKGEEMNLKEALEEMVWQFAYRGVKGKKSILHTGGLSALESAFEALGWPDPKPIDDFDGGICDVKGCLEWVVAQGGIWRETGYWCLCAKHSNGSREGKPQPEMKSRAIKREASRDINGILPLKRIADEKALR